MKGQVLHYDDNLGVGQISGTDGIRYNFTRADLKRLVPISAGTEVDFDFEGKDARDIYVVSSPASLVMPAGQTPYDGPIEPDLGFFGYFSRAITSYYANFTGRARRKEYWSFFVVPIIIYAVLGLLALFVVVFLGLSTNDAGVAAAVFTGIAALVGLAFIIPSLAVVVRRLHDVGQSGWLVLILIVLSLIPVLGIIATIGYIVLGILDGQSGANKYGPPVKRTF